MTYNQLDNFEIINNNKPINNINSNITKLQLTEYFNKNINNLPKMLEQLLFENANYTFNQYTDFKKNINNLSSNINKLIMNSEFNKNINNLPKSLKTLYFYGHFNKNINRLPLGLTSLTLSVSFEDTLDFLPESLEILVLPYCNKQINDLPSSLKYIYINEIYEKFINKMYSHKIKFL